jgi:hypothetical protein
MMISKCKITVILSVFLLVALCFANTALSQELVARWPLDEGSGSVIHDVVGGHDGEYMGGEPKWVDTQFGNGLQFDIDDAKKHVEIPRSPDLELTESLTVIAWVQPLEPRPTEGYEEIVSYANSYVLRMVNGAFCAIIIHNGSWRLLYGQIPIEAGEWYFVAMTYDSQDLKLYVDGEPDGSMSLPGQAEILPELPLWFSGHPARGDRQMNAILDEVEIWDGAMTADQIMLEYMTPSAVSPKDALTTTWGGLKLR